MANDALTNGLGAAAAEAAEGRRALVILPRGVKARDSLRLLEKLLGPRVDRVYRTNGQEQVLTKAGGCVHFRRYGKSGRSLSAALLVVPDALWRVEDVRLELLPVLATTKGGGVITY